MNRELQVLLGASALHFKSGASLSLKAEKDLKEHPWAPAGPELNCILCAFALGKLLLQSQRSITLGGEHWAILLSLLYFTLPSSQKIGLHL